jgi:hypothetical protein
MLFDGAFDSVNDVKFACFFRNSAIWQNGVHWRTEWGTIGSVELAGEIGFVFAKRQEAR